MITGLATVATSGSYNDLSNKPTIPSAYTHPTSSGNKHIPSGGSSGQILRWSADGTAAWGADNNTTYGVVSTTADGLAPKRDGSTTKFLRADGTWAVPPDNNTVYTHPSYTARTGVPTANATPGFGGTFTVNQVSNDATGHVTAVTSRTITIPSTTVTQSANGLMTSTDKTKLDGIADYIVEQGWDNTHLWYYRKWNSGRAEAWFSNLYNTAISSAWGSVYYAKLWDSLNYPSGLFKNPPEVQATSNDSETWITIKSGDNIASTGNAFLICPVTKTSAYYAYVSIYASGKWK